MVAKWPGDTGHGDASHIDRAGWEGWGFHHTAQSGKQCKIYELFISGIFHIRFLGCGWPQGTETMESKISDKGELLCAHW